MFNGVYGATESDQDPNVCPGVTSDPNRSNEAE